MNAIELTSILPRQYIPIVSDTSAPLRIPTLAELREKDRAKRIAIILPIVALLVIGLVVITRVNMEALFPARRVIALTEQWGPTTLTNADNGGPAGELVKSTLGAAGYEVDLKFTNWEIAYSRVANNEAFTAFPIVKSAERDEKYRFSDPFFSVEYVVFYRRDHVDAQRLTAEDLKSMSTVFLSGYDYWPSAASTFATKAQNIRLGNTDFTANEAFVALANGEVDFVIEGRAQGEFILNSSTFPASAHEFATLEPKYFEPLGITVANTTPLHMIFPKSTNSDVIDKINAALRDFRRGDKYPLLAAQASGGDCGLDSARIIDGAAPIRTGAGAVVTPVDGTAVTVLAWGAPGTRCTVPKGLPTPGDGEALIKFGPGPTEGTVAVAPITRLTFGADS
ncbi:substrate-binding periplasmic protein [Gordonia alkaliphila]